MKYYNFIFFKLIKYRYIIFAFYDVDVKFHSFIENFKLPFILIFFYFSVQITIVINQNIYISIVSKDGLSI